MPPKTDLTTERREQILDAAEKVFNRLGFNKARMDDIVVESGLSKGALYWYYKSKDAIILALLDRVFVGEMAQFEKLVDAEGTASERLDQLTRVVVQDMARFKHLMPLIYEFVALAARRKSVRTKLSGYYQRYHRLLSQILQQGLDSGEFVDLDPDETALAFIGLGEGLAMLWFVDPDLVDWEGIGELPSKLLLDRFRSPER
jgi:AcrR family transcriptional regulator